MAKAKTKITQSAEDATPEDSVMIAIELIREYDGNPRKNDHAVEQMADIIAAHGFRVPVLVRTSEDGEGYDLIDGHLRIKAARSLGLVDVQAILCDDMPEEQVKAFRVAVNRASEFAEWDYSKLTEELAGIRLNFNDSITLTGFDDSAFAKLAKESSGVALPKTRASEPVSRQADKAAATRETDNVSLKLDFTVAEREEVLNGLDALCKARGIDSKSAAVLQLVRDAVAVNDAEQSKAKPAARSRRKA